MTSTAKPNLNEEQKKVGDEFEELFIKAIRRLPTQEQKKVRIYRWSSVEQSKNYAELQNFLRERYLVDEEFKSAIVFFIRKFMRKKGRYIEDKDLVDQLASYVVGELPTLLQGITLDNIHYGLCVYPTYFASGMSQFVMDVHNEELKIGLALKNRIQKQAVLVEAWLD